MAKLFNKQTEDVVDLHDLFSEDEEDERRGGEGRGGEVEEGEEDEREEAEEDRTTFHVKGNRYNRKKSTGNAIERSMSPEKLDAYVCWDEENANQGWGYDDDDDVEITYKDPEKQASDFKLSDFILYSFIENLKNVNEKNIHHSMFYYTPFVNLATELNNIDNGNVIALKDPITKEKLSMKQFYARRAQKFLKSISPTKLNYNAYRVLSVFEDTKDKFDNLKNMIQTNLRIKLIENESKKSMNKQQDNISFNVALPLMIVFTGMLEKENGGNKKNYVSIELRKGDNEQVMSVFKCILSAAYKEINRLQSEYNRKKHNYRGQQDDYQTTKENNMKKPKLDYEMLEGHRFSSDDIKIFEDDAPFKQGTVFCNPKIDFTGINIKNDNLDISVRDLKSFDMNQIYLFVAYNYMIKLNKKQRLVNMVIYTHYIYEADFSKLHDFEQSKFLNKYDFTN